MRFSDVWTAARRRVGALSPRAILTAGFAVFFLYGFPGYMSADSARQLMEGRTWTFQSGHPPLMGAEWAVLDTIVAGPLLMLALQGLLFLIGAYHLLRQLLAPRAAAGVACGVLLFPPVLTTMVVIWKDTQMAAYLVAGAAALVQPRLRVRLAGLGLVLLACGMRHNAVAAAIPLVFCLFEWRGGMRWWKRLALLAGIGAVLVGAAFAVSRTLKIGPAQLTPIYHDVTGFIAVSDDRPDAEWREVLRGTPLAVTSGIQARARSLHYDQWGQWKITQGEDRLFELARTPEQVAAMARVWSELATPGRYLEAHWTTFAMMLGLAPDVVRPGPVWNFFLEEQATGAEIDHDAGWSVLQVWIARGFNWLFANTPLFDPYVYALLALLLLPLCRDRLTLGLLASGLLYELSYFPFGPNPDYRYSHWMITATVLAAVILFVRRLRGRR